MNFFKVQGENEFFEGSRMKNEPHAKFKDQNNILTYILNPLRFENDLNFTPYIY